MKICFICGCLEPGRDGVGDYARRLAAELIRQGQQCCIVSLNDKCQPKAEIGKQKAEGEKQRTASTQQKSESRPQLSIFNFQLSAFIESQTSEGTSVECLRLPGTLLWETRVELAQAWVAAFNPDWVSLQFVPFGFHPKGLCFGLGKHLKAIIGDRPLHWMFHELWVKWDFGFKKKALGWVQKIWFRQALKSLAPLAISTQLNLYQTELGRLGWRATLIPLPGNIPICASDESEVWWAQRDRAGLDCKTLRIGFFGHFNFTLNQGLLRNVLMFYQMEHPSIAVYSAGRLPATNLELWNSLSEEFQLLARFVRLGELNEREASCYFAGLDYGITAYAPELVGKSGAVAAMMEHGLPVICCGSLISAKEVPLKTEMPTVFQPAMNSIQQTAVLLTRQLHKGRGLN